MLIKRNPFNNKSIYLSYVIFIFFIQELRLLTNIQYLIQQDHQLARLILISLRTDHIVWPIVQIPDHW